MAHIDNTSLERGSHERKWVCWVLRVVTIEIHFIGLLKLAKMRNLLKCLLLSLIVSGCAGPETIAAFKYFSESVLAPFVASLSEVVVPTDDSTYPYKILYIGSTTKSDTLRALRSPDNGVGSSSGYSYWDYCYSQGNKIALKISRQRQECNALRLYFDNRDVLYNHGHVVKASYAGVTKKSSVQLPKSL